MKNTRLAALSLLLLLALPLPRAAAGAEPPAGVFTPRVTDITIFKDGHVLLLREGGGVPVDGELATAVVPEALLGSFWVLSEPGAPAPTALTVGWREVEREVPCVTIPEILAANQGRMVVLSLGNETLRGRLLERPAYEEEREVVPTPQPALGRGYDRWGNPIPQPTVKRRIERTIVDGDLVFLQGEDGALTCLRQANITRVVVTEDPVLVRRVKQRERVLRFRFSPEVDEPVRLAFLSLERGVRWIPEYRVDQGADGRKAQVRLQATVINDIVDLDDARAHFVVGVPNFLLGDSLSPLALTENPRQLSRYFDPPQAAGAGGNPVFHNWATSNAVMSQAVMPAGPGAGAVNLNPLPAGVAGAEDTQRAADFFIYHHEGLTLAAGERAAVSLWSAELPAQEVYTWTVGPKIPPELWRHVGGNQRQQELAQAMDEPRVQRSLRLTNDRPLPLTTGPALLCREGQAIGQEIITYTSAGNAVDVPLSTAVDVNASGQENELGRDPNHARINGTNFTRTRLAGELRLVNFSDESRTVIITRYFIGRVTAAAGDGRITTLSWEEASRRLSGPDLRQYWPWHYWWGYWPWWWRSANSVTQVEWTVELDAGEEKTLEYAREYLTVY